jgi:hypothetical protein
MKTPAAIRRESGVALVTTVIVVAMLAVVAVALMQSTTIDRLSSRTSSNYFQAQLAAQAGLAEAMAAIAANSANFSYVTGAEPQGGGNTRTFIRPVDGSSGVWRFNGSPVYLDSGIGGDEARFIITGDRETPGVLRTAAWKTIERENPRPNETVRYAFFADEAGSKQNLGWWGGGAARGVATNLADLTLQLPDLSGESVAPFPASAAQSLSSLRTYSPTTFRFGNLLIPSLKANLELPSVATLNVASPAELAGRINGYFFALSSPSGASTPSGGVKLNIAALAQYVDGLSADQGEDSPRAQLVNQLLTPNAPESANWGGGDLAWLATSGNYTEAEQKQIVANLVDYLDEDLIPTTDSTDTPTYLGVESKVTAGGSIKGHPYITTFGAGCVFNRKPRDPNRGFVNSSRVLFFFTMANPWGETIQIDGWFPGSPYTPEIEVEVSGTALNGNLGSDARDYFSSEITNAPPVNPITLINGGAAVFPGEVGGRVHFASMKSFQPDNRQPPNLAFNNLQYSVKKLKLKFTDDSGREGYVQILPAGKTISALPATMLAGGHPPDAIKFIFTEPSSAEQQQWYLQGDPRANFRSSSWVSLPSSTATPVPVPDGDIDPFASADTAKFDGEQGIPRAYDWYSSGTTNHFARSVEPGMSSIGEFGYLWTGKPWQTLNLTRTDSPSTEDWNLLDYVSAGRSAGGVVVSTLPLGLIGPESEPASLVAQGGFNINTRKTATLSAVLQGAPDLSADAAASIAQLPPTGLASPYGQIAEWTEKAGSLFAAGADTKFKREAAQRAMANIAVAQSRVFTIYTAGEYQQGTTRSRAYLEADVFLDVDPSSGNPRLKILSQRYN